MTSWKNDNYLSRFEESLPVEDRDAYKTWKDNYDHVNSKEYKADKYHQELNHRNQELFSKWSEFLGVLQGSPLQDEGTDEGWDDKWVPVTGYFDSGFVDWNDESLRGTSSEVSGGIYLYYLKGGEVGGSLLEEVIPAIKKHGGMEILVGFDVKSDEGYNLSDSQIINYFIRDKIKKGFKRTQAGEAKNFLTQLSNKDYSSIKDMAPHGEIEYSNNGDSIYFNVVFTVDAKNPPIEIADEAHNLYDQIHWLLDMGEY